MEYRFVSESDIDSWYVNGSPDDCPLLEKAAMQGSGVYVNNNGNWERCASAMLTPNDIRVVTDMLDLLQTKSELYLESKNEYNSLRNVLFKCLEVSDTSKQYSGDWMEMQIKLGGNYEVLCFIENIRIHEGRQGFYFLQHLYTKGYCYYFAAMLKEAFGRGTLVEAVNYGHILWKDVDGHLYDINGVCTRDLCYQEDFNKEAYLHTGGYCE